MARDARAAPALFQAVRVDADEWNRRVQEEEEAAEDEALPDAPAATATLPVQAADAEPAGDAVLAATPATVPNPTDLKHKARMVCAVESFVLWSVHTARVSVHGAQNPASV
jgi:hypothetical protein